jgi:hypothetical protein
VPATYDRHVAQRHNNNNPLFGEWAEVTVEQVIDVMRHIVAHQDEAIARGARAATYIRANETTDMTAKQLLAYFDEFKK